MILANAAGDILMLAVVAAIALVVLGVSRLRR
jgi:hypothetical protein